MEKIMTKSKSLKQKNLLDEILTIFKGKSLELLISNGAIRKRLIRFADKKIYQSLLQDKNYPRKVQEDKYYMVRSIMLAINKAFEQAGKAPAVRKALMNALVENIFLKEKPQIKKFEKDFGRRPPSFLTISPGKFCNLKCTGCYANSSSAASEKLDWDILDRIVTEKTNLWGSYFTVISGGEPLLYKSQGKTIIDLAKNHPDNYFLMYTNGTLIDDEMAKKIAEVGNITPAISIEGFEKETNERRGRGIYQRILKAMENLRNAGVPFGISFTATKNNAHLIMSDEFIDYWFNKQGALYGWIFQLMPIGRASFDLMVTPEQRLEMFRRTQHLIKDRKIFIADFWNCGSVSNGCISAGREGGYLYIEWNGNITPCVFNPYAVANINEVYKNGDTLNDVLNKPFLKRIRRWQDDYALKQKPENMGNWILPCPIRDHYKEMRQFIEEDKPQPIDSAAEQALQEEEYKEKMINYDEALAEVLDPIWENEYKKSKKVED